MMVTIYTAVTFTGLLMLLTYSLYNEGKYTDYELNLFNAGIVWGILTGVSLTALSVVLLILHFEG